MMPIVVGALGALTALLCGVLLWRGYRAGRQRLLMWSALCFIGLALSNVLLVLDIVGNTDLHVARLAVAAVASSLMLLGLVWETERHD